MKKANTQSSKNQRRSSVQKINKDELNNLEKYEKKRAALSPKISEYRKLLFSPKRNRKVENSNNSFQKLEINNVPGLSSAKLYEIESLFKKKG